MAYEEAPEVKVLTLLSQGLSDKEVAAKLYLSFLICHLAAVYYPAGVEHFSHRFHSGPRLDKRLVLSASRHAYDPFMTQMDGRPIQCRITVRGPDGPAPVSMAPGPAALLPTL